MELFLAILAFVLLLIGFVGCVIPVIPGPPLGYVGILLMQMSGYGGFSTRFLIIMAVVTVAVTAIDLLLPVWMTKRFGGSLYATWGAGLGLVAGIFLLPPLGIILFPFLGALAGQFLHDSKDSAKAFRVAFASFAAFMAGTGLKLVTVGVMIFYSIRAFFV